MDGLEELESWMDIVPESLGWSLVSVVPPSEKIDGVRFVRFRV